MMHRTMQQTKRLVSCKYGDNTHPLSESSVNRATYPNAGGDVALSNYEKANPAVICP